MNQEMNNISLKILNESKSNTLQYLPYGVTTVEVKIEGDKSKVVGFVYPKNRTGGRNKFHVGYADDNEDFLVMWGGGKRDGLQVTETNFHGRLFLQLLHKGKSIANQTLTLHHSNFIEPINKIELVPAVEDANVVKMNLNQEGELCTISFTGSTMPLYYPRWFPPRLSQGKMIQYSNVDAPPIRIKFKAKSDEVSTNVNSDIDIFLGQKKIAEVAGDWRYSWPHAELFTVFGDSGYLVLRFWLYWVHENYSKNIFLGVDAFLDEIGKPKDEQTRRGLLESFDIESPDIERFDFLIDVKKKKVSWMGTDFHYQEYWYMFQDVEFVKAKIANDVETIAQVLKNLRNRINPPENYDPMEGLKEILRKQAMDKLEREGVPEIKEYSVSNLDDKGNVTYRAEGFTRKHVPYAENGETVAQLVSSVVTH